MDPICHGNGPNNQGSRSDRNITPHDLVPYRAEDPKKTDDLSLAPLSLNVPPKELRSPASKLTQSPPTLRQTPIPTHHNSERAVSEVSCFRCFSSPSSTPVLAICSSLIEANFSTHQLPLIKRYGENKTGRELRVTINAYPIVKLPKKTVYQYEVGSIQIRRPSQCDRCSRMNRSTLSRQGVLKTTRECSELLSTATSAS